MIFIKENVERIYEKLSKIASAKERKTNKKQYLLTQPFEDCLSEREREREREREKKSFLLTATTGTTTRESKSLRAQKPFGDSNSKYNNTCL
jgi:hypothetical protein